MFHTILGQDGEAVRGLEAEASQRLRPVVARMKVCEARLLSAIQSLARRSADD